MLASPIRPVAIVCAVIILTTACGKKNKSETPSVEDLPQFGLWSDDQEKGRWLDRVSRLLRHGKELTADESGLMERGADEIVTYMMDDPDFAMSVLDFNLHFLGFRSEKLKMPDGGPSGLFGQLVLEYYSTYSSAVESARNVTSNGNYLAILGLGANQYLAPLAGGKVNLGGFELDIDEYRQQTLTRQIKMVGELKTLVSNGARHKQYCDLAEDLNTAIPFDGSSYLIWDWAIRPAEKICSQSPPDDEDPALPDTVAANVAETDRRLTEVRAFYKKFEKSNYLPKRISDLVTADVSQFEITPEVQKLNTEAWFWRTFRNSSTNMNRKRAAYVLKRFFCDDLTPIGIEAPETHANGDRHATDPGCQSCHYKLDPMAGFFRNYGSSGLNYSTSDYIFFDDGAMTNRLEYIKQWRNADDTAWNVGYVRSVTDHDLNDMPVGDPGVPELFAMINKAPEVKQCLVKNLFSYLVGEGVALDRGYLTELTQKFTERATTNSTEALKETIRSIVTSKSFVEESPEKGVCYDYASGYESDGKPPCEVAYVLSNSCEQCHSATNNQGGLDVSTWTKGKGFTHVDADGIEVSFHESLSRIDERLTSADPAKRMPLSKHMSSFDRDLLYRWVKAEMEKK